MCNFLTWLVRHVVGTEVTTLEIVEKASLRLTTFVEIRPHEEKTIVVVSINEFALNVLTLEVNKVVCRSCRLTEPTHSSYKKDNQLRPDKADEVPAQTY